MGDDDAETRRRELTERAHYHAEALRLKSEAESAKAQALIDRFVEQARQQGLPTQELMAKSWSGGARYRTGLVGWYIRRTGTVGIGTDGSFYVLNVPPVRFGRWRTVHVEPTAPPLVVGKGAGDGEVFDLDVLLQQRLQWPGPGPT